MVREGDSQNNFVTFHHYEERITAIEAAFAELTDDLLAYVEADMSCGWLPAAKRLAETLRKRRKTYENVPK